MLTSAGALVNQMCRINPLVPAHQYNKFLVRSIDDDREIVLEKTSCGSLVHVPLRRVTEILPESGSGRLPTLVLNGKVQFNGSKRTNAGGLSSEYRNRICSIGDTDLHRLAHIV